ncbi:MAG: hypothetical protein NTW50_00175 [Candidatus Berkelbacteria bacterium]|nr:hypothetical protein [Candidatus Berkelbacteria bacterium]
MICGEITKMMNSLVALERKFSLSLSREKQGDTRGFADKIKLLIDEFLTEYPRLDLDFLTAIGMPQTKRSFVKASVNDIIVDPHSVPVLHRDKSIRQSDFDRLMEYLKGQFSSGEISDAFQIEAIRLFFSIYKQSKKPIRIKFDDLSNYSNDPRCHNFGSSLNGGNIMIDRLEQFAFLRMLAGDVKLEKFEQNQPDNVPKLAPEMLGGRLEVGEAVGVIGEVMQNGTIIINTLRWGEIAPKASGGTVYVKDFLAKQDQLTTEICFGTAGGTFLIENIGFEQISVRPTLSPTIFLKSKRNRIRNRQPGATSPGESTTIAYYDEEKDKVGFVNPYETVREVTYFESSPYINSLRIDHGVINFTIPEKFGDNIVFSWVEGGVVFVKDAGICRTIGKGMTNGIIIVDDPSVDLEEAKSRVAPKDERPGGVVLYLRKWVEGKYFKKKKAEFILL